MIVPCTFHRVFPLVMNFIFIVSGITMITYGIAERLVADEEPVNKVSPTGEDLTVNGSLSIAIGMVDIVIGIFGMYCFLVNTRLMIIIYLALISASILGYIAFLIAHGVIAAGNVSDTRSGLLQDIKENYGNNTDAFSRRLTNIIDVYQKEMPCCGWTGIDGKNVFLETVWHSEINRNISGKPRTLPDTCCVVFGDDCRASEDVKAARDKSFVHKDDCMDVAVSKYTFSVWIVIVEVIIVVTMQISMAVFSLMSILKPPPSEG